MTQVAVPNRTLQAYHAKLAGYSPSEIAEKLDYSSGAAVTADIKRYLEREARHVHQELRDSMLTMELDRLDYLQSKVWPQCEFGDLKAVETALKIINTRTKLLGLDAINASTNVNTVLVVGGEESDYIRKLKEIAEES